MKKLFVILPLFALLSLSFKVDASNSIAEDSICDIESPEWYLFIDQYGQIYFINDGNYDCTEVVTENADGTWNTTWQGDC